MDVRVECLAELSELDITRQLCIEVGLGEIKSQLKTNDWRIVDVHV